MRENRMIAVLLAALFLALAFSGTSFADTVEETGKQVSFEAGKSYASRETGGESLQLPTPMSVPFASDETEQGRTYLTASAGGHSERNVSLRKFFFLAVGATEINGSTVRADRHTGVSAPAFDNLFIIHFIHNQDGQKA